MSNKMVSSEEKTVGQTVVGKVSSSQAAAVIELATLHSQATQQQAETARALGELHETVAQIAWNTSQAAKELRNIEKECYFMEGRSDAASRTMTDIGRQLCQSVHSIQFKPVWQAFLHLFRALVGLLQSVQPSLAGIFAFSGLWSDCSSQFSPVWLACLLHFQGFGQSIPVSSAQFDRLFWHLQKWTV